MNQFPLQATIGVTPQFKPWAGAVPTVSILLECQLRRRFGKALVERPERYAREARGGQQVHVNPAKSAAVKLIRRNEVIRRDQCSMKTASLASNSCGRSMKT
jgi:hypothetical protein